jgi:hypothetical protein
MHQVRNLILKPRKHSEISLEQKHLEILLQTRFKSLNSHINSIKSI